MKKIFFLLFILSALTYAFQIDDITFDMQVGGLGFREYKIYNDGAKKQIYKVKLKGKGKYDITKDMEVYPKILVIEPLSYATLKIYGGEHTDIPRGEYSFYLSFNPVVVPTISKDKKTGNVGGTSTVGIIPEIEMKAYTGEVDWAKSLDIDKIFYYYDKNNKLHMKFDVVNKGYTTTTVAIRFANKENNKTHSKYLGRVSPGKRLSGDVELGMYETKDEVERVQLYNSAIGIIYIDKNLKTKEISGGKRL